MRMPTALLALVALATPATASSGDAWETFRQDVATACTALLQEEGDVAVEVNPFGSDRFGAAIVTLTTASGTDRMICVYVKETGTAELTSPF
tara:strand:+ start:955 stop:1230 length:276 start_codon:yes stop_codon:yes gene_type:complete